MVRMACLQLDIVVRPGIHIVPNTIAEMNSRDQMAFIVWTNIKKEFDVGHPLRYPIPVGELQRSFYYATQSQACNTVRAAEKLHQFQEKGRTTRITSLSND